jgi:DNA-binding winged helix-turn-helix (wHTH) protein
VQFHFGDYALDVARRELRCGPALVAVEPQVFDLLVYLVRNRNQVVSKDDLIAAVWGGRIVSSSTLTTRINAVRKAVGDRGDQQTLIRTIARKGFRFVGPVTEGEAVASIPGQSADAASPRAPSLRQEIRYCTTRSDVRIAYAACGDGPPLVKTANWIGCRISNSNGRARSGAIGSTASPPAIGSCAMTSGEMDYRIGGSTTFRSS